MKLGDSLNFDRPRSATGESVLSRRKSNDRLSAVDDQFVTVSSGYGSLPSFPATTARAPPIMIELSLSIRGMAVVDLLAKPTSCFVAMQIEPVGCDRWVEFGLTEVISTATMSQSYDRIAFSKKFQVQYNFQERQMVKFEVFNGDCSRSCKLIGKMEASLGEMVYATLFGSFERHITRPDGSRQLDAGFLQITAEEATSFRDTILLQFAADHLPSKVFRKHAFFFELHRIKTNGELVLIHRSSTMAGHHVVWDAFFVNMHTLCNGCMDESLRFSLWRRRRNGIPLKLINFFNTTTRTLMEGSRSMSNVYRMQKRCTVRLAHLSKSVQFSFLDHVHANSVKMHCMVAVDFTSSNGHLDSEKSLHKLQPGVPNQYQTALRAVLEILQDYDTTKTFPAFGFGARVPPHFDVYHRFHLNGDPTDPNCHGIDNVLRAYEKTTQTVRMHEPTRFEPIIRHASRIASAELESGRHYYVLLILTDGGISDMASTVDAIVDASSLPLSIVIIGIGDNRFDAMHDLDADESVLVSRDGRIMERDIVQFVPFNRITSSTKNLSPSEVQANLAREVLQEVPGQFLSHLSQLDAIGPTSALASNILNATDNTLEIGDCSMVGGQHLMANISY